MSLNPIILSLYYLIESDGGHLMMFILCDYLEVSLYSPLQV